MEGRDTRKLWLVAAILGAIALDIGIFNGLLGSTEVGTDFKVFWDAAQRPLESLYPGVPMEPFVNPPTALFLFTPLAWLPTVPSYLAWTGINVVAFYAGLRQFFTLRQVLFAMLSPLFVWCLYLGQSTPLLAGALAFGMALPPVAGGALIAFALLVKPQIAWLLPFALVLRSARVRLASVLGFGSAGVLTSLLVIGWGPWRDWIVAMPAFRDALLNQPIVLERSISLSAQVQPFGSALAFAAEILAFIFVAYVLLRAARNAPPARLLLLAIAASALAAPYSLPHDVLALLPLGVGAIQHESMVRRACGTLFYFGVLPALFVILFLVDQALPRPVRLRSRPTYPPSQPA